MAYENTQAASSVGQYKHGRAGGLHWTGLYTEAGTTIQQY